jgi:hypothetical protein
VGEKNQIDGEEDINDSIYAVPQLPNEPKVKVRLLGDRKIYLKSGIIYSWRFKDYADE